MGCGTDPAGDQTRSIEPEMQPLAMAAPITSDRDDTERPYATPQGQLASIGGLGLTRAETFPHLELPVTSPEAPAQTVRRHVPDLQNLLGMDRDGLRALLGKPTLRRSEPPAEVWQYIAAQCVLHVYFYGDAANSRYLVAHVDAVPRDRQGVGNTRSGVPFQQDCFGRVLHATTAQIKAG